MATGKTNDAINEVREAVRLDPFWPVANIRPADMLYYTHHYDEALAQTDRVFELAQDFFQTRVNLARADLRLGRCGAALAALEQLPEQTPSPYRGVPGLVSAKCGRPAQAQAELLRFRADANAGKYVSHYSLAMIYAGLDDKEGAFAELDSAYAERTWAMFILKPEPAFDGLRGDPRFARLVKKVGLPS